jgi:hypothetical protein
MPITLVTGTPGAGKTLYAVKMIIDDILPLGRPIYTNINGLDIDNELVHVVGPEGPLEWQSYPDGAFCIFDEVQEQYPFKNAMSKTPDFVRGYETHRHQGKDFVFVTQGPYLLDRHLFPLIDKHIHLYRVFGMKRSTVLQWSGVNSTPQPKQTRTNAVVTNFSFPKRLFAHYKSASVHTVKASPPWGLIVKLSLIFILIFGGGGFLLMKVRNSTLLNMVGEETTPFADVMLLSEVANESGDPANSRLECVKLLSATPTTLTVMNGSSAVLLDRRSVKIIRGNLFSVQDESHLALLCNAS